MFKAAAPTCDRKGPWILKEATQPTLWPANMWQTLQEDVTLPLKHREGQVQLAHLFHLTEACRNRTEGNGFRLKVGLNAPSLKVFQASLDGDLSNLV